MKYALIGFHSSWYLKTNTETYHKIFMGLQWYEKFIVHETPIIGKSYCPINT